MAEHQQSPVVSHRPRVNQLVKAGTAATAGSSLLFLSGLTLTGTVIALALATPLMVLFSPVLLPAVIIISLIGAGFLTSGGFGFGAILVLSWIYRYVTGKQPPGAESLDQARLKLAGKAREMKDRAEQFGQHVTGQQTS
ncbi:oleosin L [Ricinus communis]|uniref:Oleosin n=1 Tax=Ricinus communis TaxID=3988 RepID=Q5VKJ8_RICCO|nr:oleosin L [Ricinus communis]AAR15172.1 oleosin [Ricinus communis]EEF51616.1 Oleosin 2 [Ricinus communis]|eukprot:XP_002511014.1 oleosin 1 [Ricinus communis]